VPLTQGRNSRHVIETAIEISKGDRSITWEKALAERFRYSNPRWDADQTRNVGPNAPRTSSER
jgi:hypothetical protein